MAINNHLRRLAVFFVLFCCFQMALANTDDAIDRLSSFLDSTQSLRADFHQVVIGKAARKPQESSGTMLIQRPGKFRWEVRKPYPQLIVGDSRNIWLYDPELKQVTVKKSNPTLGDTPAALLAGEGGIDTVKRSFELEEDGKKEGLVWLKAIPKSTDTGFESVRIGFDGKDPAAMELTDAFSQVTYLRFTGLERNVRLSEDRFQFTPPPGVDVVGETLEE